MTETVMMAHRKKRSQSKQEYKTLNETPLNAMYPKPVLIKDTIYIIPDYMHSQVSYLNNFCNDRYVDLKAFRPDCYKYNTKTDEFSQFIQCPKELTSMYGAIDYNPKTKEIIYIGGTHNIFATLPIKETDNQRQPEQDVKWNLDYNLKGIYETTGPLPSSIFIDGTFHLIGGHNNSYHEIYDIKQKRMKPVYKFDSRLKGRALLYCKRMESLIMFGGCQWTENFKHNVRFRYIDSFLICKKPNDLQQIQWDKKAEWRLPYKMMGFGYFMLNDDKILIFGGRLSGGQFSDECWMFDMVKNQWWRSNIKIPSKGKYYAFLVPARDDADIADVDEGDHVQLFQYGHPSKSNQSHYSIPLYALLNSMEIVQKLPEPALKIQNAQNEKIYSMNKMKYSKLSFNELANEVLNNKDLSKNMRKKMLRKLKKKQQKYSKPFIPQKDDVEFIETDPTKLSKGKSVKYVSTDTDYYHKNDNADAVNVTSGYGKTGVLGMVFTAFVISGAVAYYMRKTRK